MWLAVPPLARWMLAAVAAAVAAEVVAVVVLAALAAAASAAASVVAASAVGKQRPSGRAQPPLVPPRSLSHAPARAVMPCPSSGTSY